jgi:FkbM family methyltransferase
VDVGSNRGQVLREAVRIAPAARHVAFEPIPALAAEIERELPQVDCRALALGATAGEARFCHFTKLDGWSGLQRNPEITDERGAPEYIDVRVSTLDEQLPDLGPAVVKVDVEGAELQVLEGGRGLLSGARPLLIFEHVAETAKIYGARSDALWELLSGLGYAIFTITGAGPLTQAAFVASEGTVNWLATPPAS